MVRTRFAPSPTGIPHIGNTRTALYNFLFARHNNGKFVLRIEDTDRARFVPEAESAIIEILKWLNLNWDEKYTQSKRLSIYKEYAQILRSKNLAYNEDNAVRFRMSKTGETSWIDLVGNKTISFKNETQEDFIILKSDDYPTYNFASVVDDHLMEITHVIRGAEFISSTPKHLQLYKAFGWELPKFAHLPLILGQDHQKLSKRHGAKSALDYKKEGYLKEAIINFIALLGWNPGENKEIIDIDTMIKLFDLKDINTGSPIFDIKKLEWMNGMYIRQTKLDELKSHLRQGFGGQAKLKNIDETLLDKFIPLAQTRMKTLNDFYNQVAPFFEELKVELNEKEKQVAKKLFDNLSLIPDWNDETILSILKQVIEEERIRMPIIYKILTGKESGLPLPQGLEILGKEKVIDRLKKIL